MLISFKGTGERLGDKIGGELGYIRRCLRWNTGGNGEIIDELEDKELWECAAQVGDPIM